MLIDEQVESAFNKPSKTLTMRIEGTIKSFTKAAKSAMVKVSINASAIETLIAASEMSAESLMQNVKSGFTGDYISLGSISLSVKDGEIQPEVRVFANTEYARAGDSVSISAEYGKKGDEYTKSDGTVNTYETSGFHLPDFICENGGNRRREHQRQISDKAELLKQFGLNKQDLMSYLLDGTVSAPKQESETITGNKPIE